MRLVIKNMVCPRCIMAVRQILDKMHTPPESVLLGEVVLDQKMTKRQLQQFAAELEKLGFELLDDERRKIVEKIKNLLVSKLQEPIEDHFSISKYLKKHIFKDYSHISRLFSEVEGITIEQFFILHKIEKAKEYLSYNEERLQQIAALLGYSSSQHLSAQFKKITGMTPSQFKALGHGHRNSLDAQL